MFGGEGLALLVEFGDLGTDVRNLAVVSLLDCQGQGLSRGGDAGLERALLKMEYIIAPLPFDLVFVESLYRALGDQARECVVL